MIVAGFGFTTRATASSLEQALAVTGYTGPIDLLACPDDKALAPAMLDFAKSRRIQITAIFPRKLQRAQTQTQSKLSRLIRRTGSVAEAAALAGVGQGATLLIARHISDDGMATCAIAQGDT